MAVSKEKQKKEAVARLERLVAKGLHENVLADFKESGLLNYSERVFLGAPVGALYWIGEGSPTRFADAIREFEEEYEATVYHAMHERTEFGELLDLFYVSKHDEEWEADRRLLEDDSTYAMVVNLSNPDSSEIGMIGFKVAGGGVARAY